LVLETESNKTVPEILAQFLWRLFIPSSPPLKVKPSTNESSSIPQDRRHQRR
jgi:hypothetical protein